jgi:hypothetical protein
MSVLAYGSVEDWAFADRYSVERGQSGKAQRRGVQ